MDGEDDDEGNLTPQPNRSNDRNKKTTVANPSTLDSETSEDGDISSSCCSETETSSGSEMTPDQGAIGGEDAGPPPPPPPVDDLDLVVCWDGCSDTEDEIQRRKNRVRVRKFSDSEGSWSSSFSTESHQDEMNNECKDFMTVFVTAVFNDESVITQVDKARFGQLCLHGVGRLWFSRLINSQRVERRKVSEQIFYRLVQFFAIALFECDHSDDFTPAKNLMNMCFTFYFENRSHSDQFLYAHLRSHPIWKSLRFWNAAYFDSVQTERLNREPCTRDRWFQLSPEERRDIVSFDVNVAFGQLCTFTSNMISLGLNRQLCLDFLTKQSIISNLDHDQVTALTENIDRMCNLQ